MEEKESLEEVSLELELLDEDEEVLYKLGDSFVHVKQSRALEMLEKDGEKAESEVRRCREQARECEEGMEKLKVGLYAKFGSNISECKASGPGRPRRRRRRRRSGRVDLDLELELELDLEVNGTRPLMPLLLLPLSSDLAC